MAMPVPEAESVGAESTSGSQPASDEQYASAYDTDRVEAIPDIQSPSIAADMPDDAETAMSPVVDVVATSVGSSRPVRTRRRASKVSKPAPAVMVAAFGLAAVAVALVAGRSEVIRLMPQTAAFFNTLGLGVNLRGIEIENVRVSSDKVDGTTMMLVEGELRARKNVDVPRMRFGVRDANGTEIHSWNAAPEQPTMHIGERTAFKTILASPPRGAREITVRFLQKGDVSAGAN
jgi:hypothetical protein